MGIYGISHPPSSRDLGKTGPTVPTPYVCKSSVRIPGTIYVYVDNTKRLQPERKRVGILKKKNRVIIYKLYTTLIIIYCQDIGIFVCHRFLCIAEFNDSNLKGMKRDRGKEKFSECSSKGKRDEKTISQNMIYKPVNHYKYVCFLFM